MTVVLFYKITENIKVLLSQQSFYTALINLHWPKHLTWRILAVIVHIMHQPKCAIFRDID